MPMKHLLAALSLLAATGLTFSPAVYAGEGHSHGPNGHKPVHGGQFTEVGNSGFELVAKADSISLYVSEQGQPIATTGAKATATVFAGSDKTSVTLEPAGENRLVAQGKFKTGLGVRVAISLTLAGKSEQKLNFRLK